MENTFEQSKHLTEGIWEFDSTGMTHSPEQTWTLQSDMICIYNEGAMETNH